jgi:uncharacterized protein (DUF427 family)
MAKSPGHREHPDHKVNERHLDQRVTVEVNGEPIASSRHVVRVDEDGYPPRYYFPRVDVRMEKLTRTATTTTCPFKGVAHYYSVSAGGRTLADAVWTYEDPYEEHPAIKDRLAFWDGKFPEIVVEPH